jgi:hypothetical protein
VFGTDDFACNARTPDLPTSFASFAKGMVDGDLTASELVIPRISGMKSEHLQVKIPPFNQPRQLQKVFDIRYSVIVN